MTHTANGHPLLSVDITEPRIGTWRGEISVDCTEDKLPVGAVALSLNGVTFIGTVKRAAEYGGVTKAWVVGGKGGLSKEIDGRNYAAGVIRIGTVLDDILRLAGETRSSSSDPAVLSKQLPMWHREAGVAQHALVRLLDAAQATFRVNRAGEVWAGVDTYPTADPDHVLTDEDWSAGIFTLDVEAPELGPGTTFREQKIEQCVHRLRRNQLITEAHITTVRSALDSFLARIRRDIDYSRTYPCRVSAQNADGTLQLVPDDANMKARGLDKVPIRVGIPGFKVKVPSGARVTLGFSAGDPARPFAALWDSDGKVTSVEYGNGTHAVSHVGATVRVMIPYTPLPTPGPPVPFPLVGIIETGRPDFTV